MVWRGGGEVGSSTVGARDVVGEGARDVRSHKCLEEGQRKER